MTDWLARTFVKNHRDVADASVRAAYGQMAGIVGILCNVALCIAKGLIGLAAGSVSIVADAVNNLSDAASNIVSFLGFKLASRPADPGHPMGHGRFEYLAGLVVSVLVCAVGLELVRSGLERALDPQPVSFSLPLVAVMLASIAVKAWMMGFNARIGELISSETLAATAADSRNDVLATFAVLVGAILSQFTGVSLDGVLGIALGAFVLVSGAGLVRDTVNPLLGEAPSPELVDRIRERILAAPGVIGTHDLMVHDYGPGRKFASAHVEMPAEADPLETHGVLDALEQGFLDEEGIVMTLHYDPIVCDDPASADLRNWLDAGARAIDPALAVHDVRLVPGPAHTKVIFDVARGERCALAPEEVRRRMAALAAERVPDADCKITIDDSFVTVSR